MRYAGLVVLMLAGVLAVEVSAAKKGKNTDSKKDGKAKSGFAAMDKNKDGKVSQKEYIGYAGKKMREKGNTPRGNQLRNKFDSMDQNGDLFLTKEEYDKYK